MPHASDAARRRALADFVRTRREKLDPAAHGFTDLRRRRTPGLRREEMAQVAGLSATWYSWIEQAREMALSASAVSRLAQALGLSPAERAYLFDLAGREDPHPPAPDAFPPHGALARLVAGMTEPAYVLDGTWTAQVWNAAAADLFRGWLDGAAERNLLRFLFLDPAAVALIPDHAERTRRVLAEFRADTSRHLAEPALAGLVAGLMADSPLFARLWHAQGVLGREGGLRTFCAADGVIRSFEQVTLAALPGGRTKLVMLAPAVADGGLEPVAAPFFGPSESA